jgi:TRAP-type C4-dicarboxylate transport system permease small subunit
VRRALNWVYVAAASAAALCVLSICALMVYQSFGRELGWSTSGVNDVVAWLCAAAAFLAMPHAFKHGDFVRVTLVSERLGPQWQRVLEAVALIVAAVAVCYLAVWATRFGYESWRFHEMSNGIFAVPLWIPQTSFVAGSWLFLLAVLDELAIVVSGHAPSYVTAVRERHARGDFSSDI